MACNAIGEIDVPMVRATNPHWRGSREFPGQVKKWGLTFLINTKDVEGFRAAGSLTWGESITLFWIDLKRRITAVAMMQILPRGDPHVLETMIAFEQALYATRSVAENGEQRASWSSKQGFTSVLWSSCLAMFAVGANGTAIMAALPTMRAELFLASAGVQWASLGTPAGAVGSFAAPLTAGFGRRQRLHLLGGSGGVACGAIAFALGGSSVC